jgi:c-di-GMP-binding flagellar brake protein YcgR
MLFLTRRMYFVFQGIEQEGEMPKSKIAVNRRDNPRVSIKIPVKFLLIEDKKVLKKIEDWRDSKKHGFTLDLSAGGMQLAAEHHLTVGSVLEFKIYILDKVKVVTVYARVVWTNKNSSGLHFLLMKPAEKDALTSFLQMAS